MTLDCHQLSFLNEILELGLQYLSLLLPSWVKDHLDRRNLAMQKKQPHFTECVVSPNSCVFDNSLFSYREILNPSLLQRPSCFVQIAKHYLPLNYRLCLLSVHIYSGFIVHSKPKCILQYFTVCIYFFIMHYILMSKYYWSATAYHFEKGNRNQALNQCYFMTGHLYTPNSQKLAFKFVATLPYPNSRPGLVKP